MESHYLIIVPKNQAGMDSYSRGETDENNNELFHLSESEFITLQRHHVFDILNERFNLWIDDGEAETVTAEQLKDAYSAINLLNGEWKKAVDKAIKYKTCAYLVF